MTARLTGKLFLIEQCRWGIHAHSLRLTVTNFLYVCTIHFGVAQGENRRGRAGNLDLAARGT